MRVLLAYLVLFSAFTGVLVLAGGRAERVVEPQDGGILLVDIEDRRVRWLPLSGQFAGAVSVSANGRWLVFHAGGPEDLLSVFLVDLDSPEPRPQEVAKGRFPAISPDGNVIAFTRDNAVGAVQVVRMADGAEVELGPAGQLPAWSPDGRWLAFRGEYRDVDQPIDLYLADRETWQARVVAQVRVCFCDALYTPIWSADSRYFHYPYPLDGVGLVAIDGSAPPLIENAFARSADGSRLFWVETSGEGNAQTQAFYVHDFSTGESRLLAAARQNVNWSVSPRGDRFAVGSFAEPHSRLIDVETGTDVNAAVIGSVQAWSSDGAHFSTRENKGGECGFAIYEAASGRLVKCLAGVSQLEWTNQPGSFVYSEARELAPEPLPGDIWLGNVNSGRARQIAKNVPLSCLDYLTWIPGRYAFVLPSRCGI